MSTYEIIMITINVIRLIVTVIFSSRKNQKK